MATENLKSLDGRYFGRDDAGYMRVSVGIKAPAILIGAAGSEIALFGSGAAAAASTAATIAQGGVVYLSATAAKDYTLAAPLPGVGKQIVFTGLTTLAQTVTLASGTFQTTDGTTQNKLSFDLKGEAVTLMGLTTSLQAVLSNNGAVAYSTA